MMRNFLIVSLLLSIVVACNPAPSGPPPVTPVNPVDFTVESCVAESSSILDFGVCDAYWGQTLLTSDLNTPTTRLVSGKAADLFVFAFASVSGKASQMRAVISSPSNASPITKTITATYAKQQDPFSNGFLPSGTGTGNHDNSFKVSIPANYVEPGLSVVATINPYNYPSESNSGNNSKTFSPIVGAGTVLKIRFVPILLPGQTTEPTPPSTGFLSDIFPVSSVVSETRASYTFGQNLTTEEDWNAINSVIGGIRARDGDGSGYTYVGLVNTSGLVLGIGTVGEPYAVIDVRSGADRVLAHELGHTLNRLHAPCVATAALDDQYPYTNGYLGRDQYSVGSGLFQDKFDRDIMGYCGFQWISDYNYKGIQNTLEAKSTSLSSAPLQPAFFISGKISHGIVSLEPVNLIFSRPNGCDFGPLTLSLKTSTKTLECHFKPSSARADTGTANGHIPGNEQSFAFVIPASGSIENLSISGSGIDFSQSAAPRTTISAQSTPEVSLQQSAGNARLIWNANQYAYASVSYLSTESMTLAINERGGILDFSTDKLPDGGVFEVSLSDGLNTYRQEFPRH